MSKKSKRIDKKRNAMKHGVYSREVLLPGEKRSDYEAMRTAHYDEWTPEGITEECLVDGLIDKRWKKRRMDQYNQVRLQQRVAQTVLKNDVNRHRTNLKNLASEFQAADGAEAVEKTFSILSPWYQEVITGWVPRENFSDLAEWGQAVGKFLSDLKTDEPLEGGDLFAHMIDPDQLEKEIEQSNRLDESIDRIIKRLIQLKVAKQIFKNPGRNAASEPKLINADLGTNRPLSARSELMLNPVMGTEPELLAEPRKKDDVTRAAPACVTAGTDVNGADDACRAHNIIENEQLVDAPAKVEIFTKPTPLTLVELQRYSILCEELRELHGYPKEPSLASWI
ncbi:hypothetical protein [Bradyrhizobium sp.]|uniref:hypothetical protein n=1 Tax=Bradyrhizobium sp. TaxID=376 RepID=UPI0027245AFF|nr:hypothetical protein [Bradyrhizobium sp.]MDO9299471.1 hypothetical protein [Bradyrhizobium sp.]